MKKIVASLLVMSFFCLTGCVRKTLSCQLINDANKEMKFTQTVLVNFRQNRVTRFDMKTSVDLSKDYTSYADELETSLKASFEKYNGKKGIKINTIKKDNNVSLIFSANISEMDDDMRKELDIVGTSGDIKTVKADLEKEGYTCK